MINHIKVTNISKIAHTTLHHTIPILSQERIEPIKSTVPPKSSETEPTQTKT